jgi:hypothetical protein
MYPEDVDPQSGCRLPLPQREDTFGNRPVAVKVSAVGDSCPAPVKFGLGPTRAEPVVMRTPGTGATWPLAPRFRFLRELTRYALPF